MTVALDRGGHAGAASDETPPSFERDWPWLLLMWWFFGLLAYHLFLEHRAHVLGVWPYLVALVLLAAIFVAFRHGRVRGRDRHQLS